MSDSLLVCTALTSPKNLALLRTFGYLAPYHLRDLGLIWGPGHKGLWLNEVSDSLARSSLDGPPIDVCPVPSMLAGAKVPPISTSDEYSGKVLSTPVKSTPI